MTLRVLPCNLFIWQFMHIQPFLCLWNLAPILLWGITFTLVSWIHFEIILLRNFAFVFIREIVYNCFSFLCLHMAQISGQMWSHKNGLGLSVCVLWNNLMNIGINPSWKVWQHSVLQIDDPGLFLVVTFIYCFSFTRDIGLSKPCILL